MDLKIHGKCLVAILLTAVCSVAFAKEEAGEFADLLESDFNELLSFDVSVGSRLPTSILKVPGSVSVFQRQELEDMGVDTLNELLNYVPGMMTSGADNGILLYVGARGDMSSLGDNTQLLIDGVAVNNYYNSAWGLQNNLLSMHLVERVEIMRGPSSAVYGADAITGVINVITRRTGANSVSLTYGSFNSIDFDGYFQHNFQDVNTRIAWHYSDDDGETFRNSQSLYFPWDVTDSAQDSLLDKTRDPNYAYEINTALDWRKVSAECN